MRLALVIFKYFPYGGLQRDFAGIAQELLGSGHQCRAYCLEWEGAPLPGLELRRLSVSAPTNVGRYRGFAARLRAELAADPVDAVIGFNKLPGLDVYFAGDPCYLEKALTERGRLYRLGARFRHFSAWERAVFGPDSDTQVLLLAAAEGARFARHYTTDPARLHLLPPGVAPDRRVPPDAARRRERTRAVLGLAPDTHALLFLGSGFATKGLDRALRALVRLGRGEGGQRLQLLVAGQDRQAPFRRLARRLGLASQVTFLGGRDDVPDLLQAADLLLHPARREAAGVALLEALAAGLPVVTTAACGYAPHVAASGGGLVVPEPFRQEALEAALLRALGPGFREICRERALAYAAREDLYSLHRTAARLIGELAGAREQRRGA